MAVYSSAGSTLKISAAIPATFTNTAYAALSFVEIGKITDLGEFGREYALITSNVLGSRSTEKFKGSFNEGTVAISALLNNTDAGQVIAKSALESDEDHSFVITTQNGDMYYFQAKVMTFKTVIGSTDAMTTATLTLELTSSDTGIGVVEALAV